MNKTNQFLGKASYVEPSVRSIVLDAKATMMNVGSPNYNQDGSRNINGDDEIDQQNGWF